MTALPLYTPFTMQLPQFQAHAALEEIHWWFMGRRAIVQALVHAVVPPSKEKKLIDVGCGTGGMTAFFAKEYDALGVDPTEEAIAFAQSRFPGIHYVRGNAPDDVREEMRQADIVILLDVLEHVEKDVDFVHKLLDAMKPGAYFLMIAPADMSLWGPHDKGFEHYRRYEEPGFRTLWEGSGVKELLVSHCNSRLYPLAKLARTIGRMRGKAWGPADTDLSLPPGPLNIFMKTIYAGEANTLLSMLKKPGKKPYKRGVSLLALLQRT